jgi:hypothetical protein
MGMVRALKHHFLAHNAGHAEVDCTYDVIEDRAGKKYLQLDTYGSSKRKFKGKKSQSLRFSPEAIAQLKQIIQTHQL